MLLYHVALLEELGQFSEALSLLDTNAKARVIIDRTAVMERRGTIMSTARSRDANWYGSKARLLTKQGNVDEAERAWKALIQQNSDCRDYYKGYLSVKGVDLGLWYRILPAGSAHTHLRYDVWGGPPGDRPDPPYFF